MSMIDNVPNEDCDTTGGFSTRTFEIVFYPRITTIWKYTGDNISYINPSTYEYTPVYADFRFEHGWGFRRARNDREIGFQIAAERRQSQLRHLHEHYRNPITFRLQKFIKPRIVYQPCWRSSRWKSLT